MESPTLVTISNIWAYGITKENTAGCRVNIYCVLCDVWFSLEGWVTFPCHLACVRTEKLLLELQCVDSLFFVVRHDSV